MVSLNKRRGNGVYKTVNKNAQRLLPAHLKADFNVQKTFQDDNLDDARKQQIREYRKAVVLQQGKELGILPFKDEPLLYFEIRVRNAKRDKKVEKALKREVDRLKNIAKPRRKQNLKLKKYSKRLEKHVKKIEFKGKKPSYFVYKQLLSPSDINKLQKQFIDSNQDQKWIDEFVESTSQVGLQHLHTFAWRKRPRHISGRWRSIEKATVKQLKTLPDWPNMEYQLIQ